MADIRRRCRAGCGTGSRFIGKQPSLGAVHNHRADAAAHNLSEAERFCKNPLKNSRQLSRVFYNNKNRNKEIARRHNGDHNIQDLHGRIFPEHNHRCNYYQNNGRIKRRHVKGILKGR